MPRNLFFHVICIKTDSGLPLFVRSVGCDQQPPDTVISSLNGICTFCSSYDVTLLKTVSGDKCISWKTFYRSLTLILVTNASSEDWFHERIFNLIINSFVLFLGLDQLQQNANFDTLKNNLQICYHLVDSLVTLDEHCLPQHVTDLAIESLASPDLHNFQQEFTQYASSIRASHASFFIKGLLSAATKKFLQLSALELVLLQYLITSTIAKFSSSIFETVIYLPHTSPTKGWTFVTLKLLREGIVCLLFEERPRLPDIISKTQTFWESSDNNNTSKGNLNLVQNLLKMTNRSLPYMADVNKDIVSFLFVNNSLHQSLICVDLNKSEKEPNLEQGKVLKAFYQCVTHNFFDKTSKIENVGQDISVAYSVEEANQALESYMVLEAYKCYAFHEEERELYVVFNNTVPLYAIRSVTKEFHRKLIDLKWFHL